MIQHENLPRCQTKPNHTHTHTLSDLEYECARILTYGLVMQHSEKRYKSHHWGCTFSKWKTFVHLGTNIYFLGANMYILGANIDI